MIRDLIKTFLFDDEQREFVQFSDASKIRINTDDKRHPVLSLKAAAGLYSTDNDIYAITRSTTPKSIKQWLKFEVIGDFPVGTSVKVRVKNATRELFYNTIDNEWQTAAATNWNTPQEINQNLPTLPFDDKTISFIVNLKTTNEDQTPSISEIKLLGRFDLDVYQDVVETLLQKLHDVLRPVTDALVEVGATTSTLDLLGAYKLENRGYNIVGVEAVYNVTDDPLEVTNIFQSYAPGPLNQDGETNQPGVITLTGSVDAGKILRLKLKYVPELADHTDEDFYEVGKVPSFIIETMEESDRRDGLSAEDSLNEVGDYIRDIDNATAVQVPSPAHIDLRFGYAVFTDLSMDQKRIAAEIESFLNQNKLLYSQALDEPWGIDGVVRIKTENKGYSGNLMKVTGSFDIRNIPLWVKLSKNVPLVTQVNADFTTQGS